MVMIYVYIYVITCSQQRGGGCLLAVTASSNGFQTALTPNLKKTMYIRTHIYIYIYIERERKREIDLDIYIYIYTYIYTCVAL